MNIALFKQIAGSLLNRCYGLTVDDAGLDDMRIAACITANVRPFQVVAKHAEECDLYRIDIKGAWDVPTLTPVVLADEVDAMIGINGTVLVGEEIVHCPCCGSRTEFQAIASPEHGDGLQVHHCLNVVNCGHEFVTEPEGDDGDAHADVSSSDSPTLDDRIADTIIGDRIADYDGLEIQGVRNLNDPDDSAGTSVEVDNENPDFFSVYVHLIQGGVECVGDHGTYALAKKYADELALKYGWPVRDFVNDKFKLPLAA